MKEFTIGDMINALQKLDPELPIYDHYYDEEQEAEVWFNLVKPNPKKVTLYLKARMEGEILIGELTDERAGGEILERKKVVILYPPGKDEIEFG